MCETDIDEAGDTKGGFVVKGVLVEALREDGLAAIDKLAVKLW